MTILCRVPSISSYTSNWTADFQPARSSAGCNALSSDTNANRSIADISTSDSNVSTRNISTAATALNFIFSSDTSVYNTVTGTATKLSSRSTTVGWTATSASFPTSRFLCHVNAEQCTTICL